MVADKYNSCMELRQGNAGRVRRVVHASRDDDGYAMAALLVGLSIMAVLMSVAMPVWAQYTRREREEELIWRGQQYSRAIGLFQRKYANTFPPNVDVLVEQRFLRKKYKDPITNDDFQVIPAAGGGGPVSTTPPRGGQGGIAQGGTAQGGGATLFPGQQQGGGLLQPSQPTIGRGGATGVSGAFQPAIGIQGVVSKSKDASIKIFNGRTKYNEWMFVYLASAQRIGPGGIPGQPGQAGQPGQIPGGGPFSGTDRRPGVGPGMTPGGMRGQPSPFGQPSGPPPGGQQPFGQPPFGRPPVQPGQRPPGG